MFWSFKIHNDFCIFSPMDKDQFNKLLQSLSEHDVTLVAVSKTKPPEDILHLYNYGQRVFGENRAQELQEKHPVLPSDIEWHMIGHLQTNKVKYIAPYVSMIESIDSLKLLNAVSREALKNDRKIDILLQVKIAEEPSKFGFDPKELISLAQTGDVLHQPGVRIRGVMGMASFVEDMDQVRREFRSLKECFVQIAGTPVGRHPHFDTISMGMSGDYEIAISEGSTMVRLGSMLFGPRN